MWGTLTASTSAENRYIRWVTCDEAGNFERDVAYCQLRGGWIFSYAFMVDMADLEAPGGSTTNSRFVLSSYPTGCCFSDIAFDRGTIEPDYGGNYFSLDGGAEYFFIFESE